MEGRQGKSSAEGHATLSSRENLDFDEDNFRAIAEGYKNDGNDAYQKKDYSNAKHFYTEGIKVNCKDEEVNVKLYNNRATAYFHLGNYQESLNDARAAVKLKPTYIKAIARGASACLKLGQYEEAINWCDQGLTIDKHNKVLLDLRGTSLDEQNKAKQTSRGKVDRKPGCQVGTGLASGNPPLSKDVDDRCFESHANLNIGNDCYKVGDFKNTIFYYEKYLKSTKEARSRSAELIVYNNLGNAYQSIGNAEKALECHDRCLKIAKEVGDKVIEGNAYGNLGTAFHCIGDFARSIDNQKRCIKIAHEIGNRIGEARAYGNLGNAYCSTGNFKKAVECHELCLKISEETRDRIGEGYACGNLANAYSSNGEHEKAIEYHERCLNLVKQVVDKSKEAIVYSNLGMAYCSVRNFRKAIDCHERCLSIAKDVEDKGEEGRTYSCLATTYYNLGDFKRAINYHEQSLKIAKELKDKAKEERQCCNLGTAHNALGENKKALEYHERSLEIAKEVGDRFAEASAAGNIGSDYHNLGNFKKAIEYNTHCLEIARDVKCRSEEGRACSNLGNTFHSLGDFKKAIEHLELGVKIAQQIGNKAEELRAYEILGRAHNSIGNVTNAIHFHKSCVDIAKEVGDRAEEGRAYCSLGSAYHANENFEEAIECYEFCLKVAKEIEDRAEEGRATGSLGNIYYSLGDFENAKDYYEQGLKIMKEIGRRAEEGRAYGNLGNACHGLGDYWKSIEYQKLSHKIATEVGDLAAEGIAYSNLGISYESLNSLQKALECYQSSVRTLNNVRARLLSEDDWKINLRHVNQNSYTGLWRVLLKLDRPLDALAAAEKGKAQALKDLMETRYGIKTPDITSAVEEGEAVHEIFSGVRCSTVFPAVNETQGLINFWIIQNDGDVCTKSKQVGMPGNVNNSIENLIQSTFNDIGVRGASPKEKSDQTGSCSLQAHNQRLKALYDLIIDPVANLIHGDELIIVPEGPLWLIPYSALMDSNSKYLYESFRIRVIPSLTSFKLIMDRPADYHNQTRALLVGNPCLKEIPNCSLSELPDAEREVEIIGKILNTTTLIATKATKGEVLKRLPLVDLVHIAAHGRMKTGEIYLCPNPSWTSRQPKDDDYLLKIADVLSVKLRARLVVLSCCHSGRGEIKAEGVVGIVRAFLGAGARSVMVSLWAIDDKATKELMTSFYQHLVTGRSASQALNSAMESTRESHKFGEVKYWAPFVLFGDDVTLEFAGHGSD